MSYNLYNFYEQCPTKNRTNIFANVERVIYATISKEVVYLNNSQALFLQQKIN